MKSFLFATAAGIAFAAAAAAPAGAATTLVPLSTCAQTDLVPNASACQGFYAGNLINTNHEADQKSALSVLGYDWNGSFLQEFFFPNEGTTIDFTQLLTGTTYIGIHFGNGMGSPGRPSGKGDGDDTAFYRFDNLGGVDILNVSYKAGSVARLYATGIGKPPPGGEVPAVPEPSTWLMMLAGFGLIGAMVRRRGKAVRGAMQAA